MKVMKQMFATAVVAMMVTVAAPAAFAQSTGPDYSSIVGAVDWSSVITQVIAVFVAGAGLIVAFLGARFLIRALKGSH